MLNDQPTERIDGLDGHGPLWEQVRRALERKIRGGVYAQGDLVPGEIELMAMYGASRMTVHRAVRSLAAEGLVRRRRGVGTIVARAQSHRQALEIWDVEEESRREGQTYSFELLERAQGPMQLASELMNLPFATEVLWTVGLHRTNGAIIQLEQRLTNLAVAPAAGRQDYAHSAPGPWLLQNVPWSEAEHTMQAWAAPSQIATWMNIACGAPCLVIERKTWKDREPVTFARLWHLSTHRVVARFSPNDGLGATPAG